MRIFFDTNVYVSEALLGQGAQLIIQTTLDASWRIYASSYVASEAQRVLADKLHFDRRFAFLTRVRIMRRAIMIEPGTSAHTVPKDYADSPILQAAMTANADYLVTNDEHLLQLNPYQGMQIISMHDYRILLENEGLLRDDGM